MTKKDPTFDDSQFNEQAEGKQPANTVMIPTLQYYERMYARAMDQNDQKAVSVFKNYEAKEKLRRMQSELQWIKEGKVTEQVLNSIVGKKREAKYGGYPKWAELMLLWIVAKR